MFCAVASLLLDISDSAGFAQSFNHSNLKPKETEESYSSFKDTTAPKQIKEEKSALAGTSSLIFPGPLSGTYKRSDG